jgi:ADP-ribose pyrophosphatase YjhB (NUDIX family)
MDEPNPISDAVTEIVRQLVTGLTHPVSWLTSRPNRARLGGARVEVIAFMMCREPESSILLGQSPYERLWMPPQEGVNLNESFIQALRRCLQTECGIKLPKGESELPRMFHLRSIRFMGKVPLVKGRVGERLVADDAIGTWLEPIKLTKKAYWMATMLLANQSDIIFRPDGKELVDLRWFSLEEARDLISTTNHPDKGRLLLKCFEAAQKSLRGVPMQK